MSTSQGARLKAFAMRWPWHRHAAWAIGPLSYNESGRGRRRRCRAGSPEARGSRGVGGSWGDRVFTGPSRL